MTKLELIVTSPPISLADYPNELNGDKHWIHRMVGDLQRIMEYPKKGFQIPQEVPTEVHAAFIFLVEQGYTQSLINE